jgi:hypothetical protein
VGESNRGLILGTAPAFASKVQGNREVTPYYSTIETFTTYSCPFFYLTRPLVLTQFICPSTAMISFPQVGKPEGKRPLGRPRRRWEDNIKMDLQEVGRGFGDWMELARDRDRWRALVSAVLNFWVQYNAGSFLTSCRTS